MSSTTAGLDDKYLSPGPAQNESSGDSEYENDEINCSNVTISSTFEENSSFKSIKYCQRYKLNPKSRFLNHNENMNTMNSSKKSSKSSQGRHKDPISR